ncbi:hypothetical protein ZWY2020_032265 [Hordeum vulgare]|nr:hypothetical protein ZWY2020_032265 [Hordeum vulgare]
MHSPDWTRLTIGRTARRQPPGQQVAGGAHSAALRSIEESENTIGSALAPRPNGRRKPSSAGSGATRLTTASLFIDAFRTRDGHKYGRRSLRRAALGEPPPAAFSGNVSPVGIELIPWPTPSPPTPTRTTAASTAVFDADDFAGRDSDRGPNLQGLSRLASIGAQCQVCTLPKCRGNSAFQSTSNSSGQGLVA